MEGAMHDEQEQSQLHATEPSCTAFKTILSGFTPVNLPIQPAISAGGTGSINGDGAQIVSNKRKRTKPSARISEKQKEVNVSNTTKVRKPRQHIGTKVQDIATSLPRTKIAQVIEAQRSDGQKNMPSENTQHAEPRNETNVVLSRQTMHKLDGFRYQSPPSKVIRTHKNAKLSGCLETRGKEASIHAEHDEEKGLLGCGPCVPDNPVVPQEGANIAGHSFPSACQLDDIDATLEAENLLPPSNQEQVTCATVWQAHSDQIDALSVLNGFPILSPTIWDEPNEFRDVEDINRRAKSSDDEFSLDDEGLEEMIHMIDSVAEDVGLSNSYILQNPTNLAIQANQANNTRDQLLPVSSPLNPVDQAILSSLEDNSTFLSSPIVPSQSPYALDLSTTKNALNSRANEADTSEDLEDLYDDSDLDVELMNLANSSPAIADTASVPSSPLLTPKLQWLPPKTYIPASKFHKLQQPPTSPTAVLAPLSTSYPTAPTSPLTTSSTSPIPFIRRLFPPPLRDRSPILGLTPSTHLRTCFRIGEALNAAFAASRTHTDAVIELYARVISSHREPAGGMKQYFQFADLFTWEKPPFLSGVYSLWQGVGIWEWDARAFLSLNGKEGREGKTCRILGRIKRGEGGRGGEMNILSVWECDSEDVEVVRGIVCS